MAFHVWQHKPWKLGLSHHIVWAIIRRRLKDGVMIAMCLIATSFLRRLLEHLFKLGSLSGQSCNVIVRRRLIKALLYINWTRPSKQKRIAYKRSLLYFSTKSPHFLLPADKETLSCGSHFHCYKWTWKTIIKRLDAISSKRASGSAHVELDDEVCAAGPFIVIGEEIGTTDGDNDGDTDMADASPV